MAGRSGQRATSPFASQLCDWCPGTRGFETCLMSYHFPCVQYGYNVELLASEDVPCGGSSVTAGFAYLGLMIALPSLTCGTVPLGLQWILHMQLRKAIRQKYNLKPEPCNDCCTVFFCSPCAHCQERHQLSGPHNAELPITPLIGSRRAPPHYQPVPSDAEPASMADGIPVGPLPATCAGPAPGAPPQEFPSYPSLFHKDPDAPPAVPKA